MRTWTVAKNERLYSTSVPCQGAAACSQSSTTGESLTGRVMLRTIRSATSATEPDTFGIEIANVFHDPGAGLSALIVK